MTMNQQTTANETESEQMTDIAVPRKSVDPDETIEERLTANVLHQIGEARYFKKDSDGNPVEDWHGVFDRVASNIADAEYKFGEEQSVRDEWKRQFETVMKEQRFIPNTPTIASAGTELQMLSACFVISPEDSMEDILDTVKAWGLVEADGGGMGGAFYRLRPKGARVSTTGGTSSGPMPFIEMYDAAGGSIKQGSIRSGAQMAIMHAHHADVGRFIVSKRIEGDLDNFNISVAVTDEFIESVRNDESYQFYTADSLGPGDTQDVQEVLPETAHFYDPEFEDAWNEERDTPGVGLNGTVVEENVWRDYDIEGIEQYRDQIDLEVGEPLELPARFVWSMLVDGAWENGEPGVYHIDEANREHTFDVDEHPENFQYATNPCAEQMLSEAEACNLGHVNLSLMVDDNAPQFDEFAARDGISGDTERVVTAYLNRSLDHNTFKETIQTGTRFLDNVVTQSEFPLDEISEQVENKRKIGLGLMGFAQMLVQMGIPYGSEESYAVAREIMRRIDKTCTEYSHELAKIRGPFPDWEDSKWADPSEYGDWFRKHGHQDPSDVDSNGYLMRNHSQTTIAPTGTTSRVGNTTGGCEPIYNTIFFKNVSEDIQGDEMLVVMDDFLEQVLESNDIDSDYVENEAVRLMKDNSFDSISDVDVVPEAIDDLFTTTEELSLREHLEMQVAFQEHCSSGISKTGNAPFEATRGDISDSLLYGLENGVKGTTVYRQGSRKEQVNTTSLNNKEFDDTEIEALVEDAELLASVQPEDAESVVETIEDELDTNGGEN